jgi:hypothetical protein
MAEMRDEHFEVLSSNRAKLFEKQKKTTNIIRTLLKKIHKKTINRNDRKEKSKQWLKKEVILFYIGIYIQAQYLKIYYRHLAGYIL